MITSIKTQWSLIEIFGVSYLHFLHIYGQDFGVAVLLMWIRYRIKGWTTNQAFPVLQVRVQMYNMQSNA